MSKINHFVVPKVLVHCSDQNCTLVRTLNVEAESQIFNVVYLLTPGTSWFGFWKFHNLDFGIFHCAFPYVHQASTFAVSSFQTKPKLPSKFFDSKRNLAIYPRYGNTGCGVLSSGLMANCQKVTKFDFQNQFFMSKII